MLSLVRLASACVLLQCGYTMFSEPLTDDTFIYPEARRDETVEDDYHGVKVKDPYRWLEDPYSNETEQFIDAENNITRSYLDACSAKKDINARLTELLNYPKRYCPKRVGARDFFFMNSGLQDQDVLYVMDNLDKTQRSLVDTNQLSDDGTIAIADFEVTDDSNTLAYALSSSGSDWVTVHFKDVATGKDYPEILEKIKFVTMSWTKDNEGLFYSYHPTQKGMAEGTETELNIEQSLCYHKLNTSQSDDVTVVEFPEEPLWGFENVKVSDCGRYLIVVVSKGTSDNLLFFADLPEHSDVTGKLNLTQIVFQFEADYEFISNEGSVCTFRTNKDAPNYRLIQIDLLNPAPENWTTLVPENETDVLDKALAVYHDRLVLHYIRDVKSVLQLHDATTGDHLFTYDLPIGSVELITGRKNATEFFYAIADFFTPNSVWHVDLKERPHTPLRFSEDKVKGFDNYKYEAKQVFYSSKDGTKVPMFIISKKNVTLDGNNPTLLYGYGGFSMPLLPFFDVMHLAVLQNFGGIVAIPNIRGGGEYGERWHNAGRLLNKQNVFDDFQAAAEYLIKEAYTQPSLITIHGESNGGLLVAACINQRPDLFGAAIVGVGVLDMLRFQKFTIGYAWTSEYGSPDNETQFQNLLKYSPLHNIHTPIDSSTEYPATLVLTADHDDRVVPLHSLKFIAALQHACRHSAQRRPLLARVDTKAGHGGGGKPTAKIIEENTDILCFMTQALGLQFEK